MQIKKGIPFVAQWTALWYYKDEVRSSILRYKFYGKRNYAVGYGRLLGMKILRDLPEGFDVLTWVPISHRGRAPAYFSMSRARVRS